MAREDQNEAFLETSFLYGGNALYLEEMQTRYEKDPASVGAEWQAFLARSVTILRLFKKQPKALLGKSRIGP
jgi:2-oxoglutarate dehydrogenase complex dehydrogenase (E1) component-like enzyme